MVSVLNFDSYFYILLHRLGKVHHIYPARWLPCIVLIPSGSVADAGGKMVSKNKQIKRCLGLALAANTEILK